MGGAWEPETVRVWKGAQTRAPLGFLAWETGWMMGRGDSMGDLRGRARMGSLEHQKGAVLEADGCVGLGRAGR